MALKSAKAAGVAVTIHGPNLLLEAVVAPPSNIIDEIKHNKAEIIALLRSSAADWTSEDWRAFFDERAGIAEHDGGLNRSQAEAQAYETCIIEWINQNHQPSSPDRCSWCLKDSDNETIVVPFGTAETAHAWIHHGCWHDWHEARKNAAIAKLSEMSIGQGLGPQTST